MILGRTQNQIRVLQGNNSKNHNYERKIVRKKRRLEKKESSNINFDFILGSSAEIERVWAISKYIVSDHRNSTQTIILEAFVFLNGNRTYWDRRSVEEALERMKRSRFIN